MLLAFFACPYAHAQHFELVYDLNTSPDDGSSEITNFVDFNGTVYFTAESGDYGKEVYKIVGDTVDIGVDIAPGTAWGNAVALHVWNGKLYIVADPTGNSHQLFEYDPAGAPGDTLTQISNFDNVGSGNRATGFIEFANNLYFIAHEATTGRELYRYDGTTVSMVQDLNPGAGNGVYPTRPVVLGDTLYFGGDDGVTGMELWKYDGTTMALVVDLLPGGLSQPRYFHSDGTRIWFRAIDSLNVNNTGYRHVHSWDGTTLTSYPTHLGYWADLVGVLNGNMIATGISNQGNMNENWGLFEFDGSTWNLLFDFAPSSAYWDVEGQTITNNTLWFQADSGSTNDGIFSYDGTTVTQVVYPSDMQRL